MILVVLFITARAHTDIPELKVNYNEDSTEIEKTTSCGGVERWAVKVFTDPLAYTINWTPKPTSIAHLVAITTPTPSGSMPRYQPVEDSTYIVSCLITIKKDEADSDFHLVLSDGTHTLIGEVPCPGCASVAASPKIAQFIAARNWVIQNIGYGNVNNINLPPVTVTGVAFVDPPHGQTGAAPNNLEIHSIIDIHFTSTGMAPTITTLAATSVSLTSATLNGSVNPNNVSTTYHFEWGLTTSYGHSTTTASAGSGSSSVNVNTPISGLTAGTAYHFRIVATNSVGTTYGNDLPFTTQSGFSLPPEPTNYPTNFSGCDIRVQWTDATGPVIPTGYLVRMSSIGFNSIETPVDGIPVPDGVSDKNVLPGVQEAWFKNLSPNTTYYFKIFSYQGWGSSIDYKTNGQVPDVQETTQHCGD